jgi:hypothetical protein
MTKANLMVIAAFCPWCCCKIVKFATTLTLSAVLAGCVHTVVVDFDIKAQVSSRDTSGRASDAVQHEIVSLAPSAALLSPFPAQQYRSPEFEWTFGTGTLGFGGDVFNRGASPLCLRLDEAMLSSNLHPGAVKLRVYSLAHTIQGGARWTLMGSTDPNKRHAFSPPALCFAPGQRAHMTLGPDLSVLFPNETMFNVRWIGDTAKLSESGIGNSLQIELPVEQGGKRQQMQVTWTVVNSHARTSTY